MAVRKPAAEPPRAALGGPFQRPLRIAYLLSPLLCAALLLCAYAWRRQALFSPGPLAPGHAMLGADCLRCHSAAFPRLQRAGSAPAALQGNRDCLRCHQRTIGHSARTATATHHERVPSDGRACATCHQEHQGRALTQVDDAPCLGCHADLTRVQSAVLVTARISGPDTHPEFRWLAERRPDPGVLRFNHRRHLHDRLPGPDGALVTLTCQDCHRPDGLAIAWRFAAQRGAPAAEVTTTLARGEHMAPIAYDAHCAGCHALIPSAAGVALRGDDAVDRGAVPHRTPAAIRTYLRGQRDQAGAALRAPQIQALERSLYQQEGLGCQRCHQLQPGAKEGGEADPLPLVTPTALPSRFFPRARFTHARHSAAALGGYAAEGLPDCLACHPRAVESTRTADVLVPGIAECRRCHGAPSGRGLSSRGGVVARCTTCHSYHVPPPQALGPTPLAEDQAGPVLLPSLVRAGERETRQGLRHSTPLWPQAAFFELPTRVWGLPDARPGTAAFRREVFQRYGLSPSDSANDGLPLGLLRTQRPFGDEPGLTVTCDLCHSAPLFGRVVVGQPNPFVDVEQLWNDLDRVSGKTGEETLYYKTPLGNTVVNGADHLGLLGLLLRNPDLSANAPNVLRMVASAAQRMKPDFDALAYLKTPSWYNYGIRVSGQSGLYWDGGQPKDGNFAAYTYMTTFRDVDGQDLAAALAAWQRSGHAFLSTVEAPRYPFPIRAELLPQGRSLYAEHCARCHGSYTSDASGEHLSYPGLVIPVAEIGTDPKRAAFPALFVQRTREVLKEEYTVTNGYAAPPLAGVWARAPYLHNGSVPTLAELLDPQSRRGRYVLSADPNNPADYDQVRVGWRCSAPPAEPGVAVHRLYDPARLPGLGNGGHRYGAQLAAAERLALIEYLKTL